MPGKIDRDDEYPTLAAPARSESQTPTRIGRYRVERVLGQGAFGCVYLAHDSQLDRKVAIKTPHAHRVPTPEDAQAYLAEARLVARLDHPHIVPVHDVGESVEYPVFIVSKFVEGCALADHLKRSRFSPIEAARLVGQVADAVEYANRHGVVHRDIKPANLLLDSAGILHVADFGMALREQDFGSGAEFAGTPAYMSPEQARGESHLVDGRSDIFSLGVVLYEMLTGKRPFCAPTHPELLKQISTVDVRPPRQLSPSIPRELERICLKAMARRATDRYTTASDLADDLRHFSSRLESSAEPAASGIAETSAKVIPKGLQSFDAKDSDFFLQLASGVCDRHGLPESIRFWKDRMEETDSDETFRVGLIYGPSGCGKSSLVKAGLLPRLAESVRPVYVEATANETESRLLAGLRKACPELPAGAALKDVIARLRLGKGAHAARKIVLVIDQFEQWLHARWEYAGTELADALRQCDGGKVQAVVMVRDDFWMAVSRLFREIDIPLLERKNSSAVDLFDLLHARKVLSEFGRAYGRLPDNLGQRNSDQERFLDEAAAGLATEGKVVPVRLVLFSEMVKGKPWTPETLRQLGGISGVGAAFLESTFSAQNAPPAHRHHQQAARAVLKDLLPGEGAVIRGHWRSQPQLLMASGYAERPRDFADLLQILDAELRLITPTDLAGVSDEGEKGGQDAADNSRAAAFQLTHDYLVPSVREWLARKQRETRRGRAELLLAERSSDWNVKQESRHLPSVAGWIRIRALVPATAWSESQRDMMRRASRRYGVRSLLTVLLLSALSWGGYELNGVAQATALLKSLASADPADVSGLIEQMSRYRRWVGPRLDAGLRRPASSPQERRQQLHVRMAMLPEDESQLAPLLQELLRAETRYFRPLRDSLAPHRVKLAENLWMAFREDAKKSRRLRAGWALAHDAADDQRWTDKDFQFLIDELVASYPEEQPQARQFLAKLGERLLPELERVFRDPQAEERQQLGAATALADFARDDVGRLAMLAAEATSAQYQLLFPRLELSRDAAAQRQLQGLVVEQPSGELLQTDRVQLGRRRAGAAITLLRSGERESVFDVFRVTNDPESLTQFVHRCRDREVAASQLLECVWKADSLRQARSGLQRTLEDRVLFGLLLAIGEFDVSEFLPHETEELVGQLETWYSRDPSSAIHGASGWLLRHWGCNEQVERIDRTPVPPSPLREWYIQKIEVESSDPSGAGKEMRSFFFTFIVFEPGEYEIGSPDDEQDRDTSELKRLVRLTRRFAVLDREITREEYLAFGGKKLNVDKWSPPPGKHPIVGPTWYDSVAFCRSLTSRAGLSEEDQCYADPETLSADDFPRESRAGFSQYPHNWEVRLDRSGFRLPTQTEWEVMCRAGTGSAFHFGSDPSLLDRYAWYAGNTEKRTRPPRLQRPNLRGVFDAHGNVLEWCHDWYSSYLVGAFIEDFAGPPSGGSRVLRGGGWNSKPTSCRSADSSSNGPSEQGTGTGFRVVSLATFPSRP